MTDYVTTRLPMTKKGFDTLEKELKGLQDERPDIIKAISEARDLGDLSENAEYHAARERQSFIESRIAELESKKSRAEVIDVASLSGNTVMFGATVTLSVCDDSSNNNAVIYQIVGAYEADPSKKMISIESPVAISLIGKNEGEYVEIQTPGSGERLYKIMKIEFK